MAGCNRTWRGIPLVASFLGALVVVLALASIGTHGWQRQFYRFEAGDWPQDSAFVNHTFTIEIDVFVGLDDVDYLYSQKWEPSLQNDTETELEVLENFKSTSDFVKTGKIVKGFLIVAVVVGVFTILLPLAAAVFSQKYHPLSYLTSFITCVLVLVAVIVWAARANRELGLFDDAYATRTAFSRNLSYSFGLAVTSAVLAMLELILLLWWSPSPIIGQSKVPRGKRAVPVLVWCVAVTAVVFILAAMATTNWQYQRISHDTLLFEDDYEYDIYAEVGLARARLAFQATGQIDSSAPTSQNKWISIFVSHHDNTYDSMGKQAIALLTISVVIGLVLIPLPILSSYYPKVKYAVVIVGILNGLVILAATSIWAVNTGRRMNLQVEFDLPLIKDPSTTPEEIESLRERLSIYNNAWHFGFSFGLALAAGLLMIVGISYTMMFWKPRYILLEDTETHPRMSLKEIEVAQLQSRTDMGSEGALRSVAPAPPSPRAEPPSV